MPPVKNKLLPGRVSALRNNTVRFQLPGPGFDVVPVDVFPVVEGVSDGLCVGTVGSVGTVASVFLGVIVVPGAGVGAVGPGVHLPPLPPLPDFASEIN